MWYVVLVSKNGTYVVIHLRETELTLNYIYEMLYWYLVDASTRFIQRNSFEMTHGSYYVALQLITYIFCNFCFV